MLTVVSGALTAAQSSVPVSGKPAKDDKGFFAELMAALAGVAALLAVPGQQGAAAGSAGSVTAGTSATTPVVDPAAGGLTTGSPAAGDGGQGPDQGVAGSLPATGVPTVSATAAAGVLSAATLPSGAAQTDPVPVTGQATDAGDTAPKASPGVSPGSPVSAGPGVPIAEVTPAAAVLTSTSPAVSAQTGSSQQPGAASPTGPAPGPAQGGLPPYQAMTSQGTPQGTTQPAVAAQVTPAPQPAAVGTYQPSVPTTVQAATPTTVQAATPAAAPAAVQAAVPAATPAAVQAAVPAATPAAVQAAVPAAASAAVQAAAPAAVPTAVRESSPGAGAPQGVVQSQGTVYSQVSGLSSGQTAGGDTFQSASDGGSGSSGGKGQTGADNTVNPAAANISPAFQTIPEVVTASVANLPQAVARTIENYVSQGGRLPAQLELHLDPPALGNLTIHLALDAGTLSVAFVTASTHAHDAVAAGLPQMRTLLGQLGVALGQAQVFVSSGGGGTGGGYSRGGPAGWGANARAAFSAGSDEQGNPASSGTSLVNILI